MPPSINSGTDLCVHVVPEGASSLAEQITWSLCCYSNEKNVLVVTVRKSMRHCREISVSFITLQKDWITVDVFQYLVFILRGKIERLGAIDFSQNQECQTLPKFSAENNSEDLSSEHIWWDCSTLHSSPHLKRSRNQSRTLEQMKTRGGRLSESKHCRIVCPAL